MTYRISLKVLILYEIYELIVFNFVQNNKNSVFLPNHLKAYL